MIINKDYSMVKQTNRNLLKWKAFIKDTRAY